MKVYLGILTLLVGGSVSAEQLMLLPKDQIFKNELKLLEKKPKAAYIFLNPGALEGRTKKVNGKSEYNSHWQFVFRMFVETGPMGQFTESMIVDEISKMGKEDLEKIKADAMKYHRIAKSDAAKARAKTLVLNANKALEKQGQLKAQTSTSDKKESKVVSSCSSLITKGKK